MATAGVGWRPITSPSGWRQYLLRSVKEKYMLNSQFPSCNPLKRVLRTKNRFSFYMIPIKDETGEATSKAMMDIFNTHSSPEVILSDRGHERWNKVQML
jgi:hypothetical protein